MIWPWVATLIEIKKNNQNEFVILITNEPGWKIRCGGTMGTNIALPDVQKAIGKVTHPAISRTLVELGMIKDVALHGSGARLTLVLPILNIPGPVKEYLVRRLRDTVAKLGIELKIDIAEMNQEERQAFLAMERESWKGL